MSRERRYLSAAAAGTFQRIAQIVATLILVPRLLAVLGIQDFGIWGSATSLVWISGLVDIGVGIALVTLVARARAAGRPAEARDHLASALATGSAIALLTLSVCAIIYFASGRNPALLPMLIAVVGLALNAPLNSANNTWMALQKGYISSLWELVQTVLGLSLTLFAATFSRNVCLFIAIMYAALVLSNFGSLTHLLLVHPELRPSSHFNLRDTRQVFSEGFLLVAVNITGGLSFLFDNILALQLLGPEAAARMTIALRICMSGLGLLQVASQPLWPAFVEAAHHRDRHWIRNTLVRSISTLTALTLAGGAILVAFGPQLLKIWLHSSLGIGRPLLFAVSAWIVAQAIVRVPLLVLNGLSIIRFQVVVISIATAVALAIKLTFASAINVSGFLWTTTLAVLCFTTPLLFWRLASWDNTLDSLDGMNHQ